MILENVYSYLTHSNSNNGKNKYYDCIFVYAGKEERKKYGLILYRTGLAPVIIFSVGRFEWRKFLMFNFDINDAFRNLVNRTPYFLRHFFVELNKYGNNTCSAITKGQYGTISESINIIQLIKYRKFKKVLIISSGFHLRRVHYVFTKLFENDNATVNLVAVPDNLSEIHAGNWWKSRNGFSLIVSEYLKLVLYFFVIPFYARRMKKI